VGDTTPLYENMFKVQITGENGREISGKKFYISFLSSIGTEPCPEEGNL
jgi:hypothetical protein